MAEQELTYEQARDELVAVVRQLESGGVSLADSMELWQRGEKLAQLCQEFLDGAKAKVAQSRQAAESDDAE